MAGVKDVVRTGDPLKVMLLAMPWARVNSPSAALGILAAWVRQELPGLHVETRSEFVAVGVRLGLELYRCISRRRALGELFYLCQLYPERRAGARQYLAGLLQEQLGAEAFREFGTGASGWEDLFDQVDAFLSKHLENLAAGLAGDFRVIGLTTSMAQLYASLALSARLKAKAPETVSVLGGAGVTGAAGPSLLAEYDFVDHVIQGEGERPLVRLLRALTAGRPAPAGRGLLTRGPKVGAPGWNVVGSLRRLPVPDYSEYVGRAEGHNLLWYAPLESSRGCWWDRTAVTGNPRKKCYFCNYSNGPYRVKPVRQVVREVETLSGRHLNLRFAFSDNALDPRHLATLARELRRGGREYSFFASLRANLRPRELLALKEAGLIYCECGIEGLSGAYLRRLNKGTSVGLNLQLLKTCHELGLRNNTNLIVDFPGSTAEEVAESARVIRDYACAYWPPAAFSPFSLAAGSVVDLYRGVFGITGAVKAEFYRVGLPEDVFARLQLNELDWLSAEPQADWTPVREAGREWIALHQRLSRDYTFPFHHPLYYQDGGQFLEIIDRRRGLRTVQLREPWRSIYLFCLEIRSRRAIERHFAHCLPEVEAALAALVEERLIFTEAGPIRTTAVPAVEEAAARAGRPCYDPDARAGRPCYGDWRYLSLAVAATPELAARSIRGAERGAGRQAGGSE